MAETLQWKRFDFGVPTVIATMRIWRVAAWETTMITFLLTAELTVLIILCFVGPDYRH
jgi:hypothetical protein